jgi:phytoene desaturase
MRSSPSPTCSPFGARDTVDVVVVGAGLAGLSAACHARGAGHHVVVVEAGPVCGGRAGTRSIDGYRFDTGPTVLTMPALIDQCFAAVGAATEQHVTLRRVDPMYRACHADGSQIYVRHGREPMADEIRAQCGADQAAAFHRFCDWLTDLYQLELPNFIDRNFSSPLSIFDHPAALIRLVRSGAFRRLETVVRRFFDDERLVRMFSFQALYAGLAPHQALGVYAVITYMDSVSGVYVPEGGMHALPRAIERAAREAGVEFRYDTPIERIVLERGENGPVRGVRSVSGEMIAADSVVCTVDLPVAYRTLLPWLAPPRRTTRGHYSPSALVLHQGVRGTVPHGAAHHNIHFGADWKSSFEAVLDRGVQMPDPSILVTLPTLDEPSMAPPDRHVVYALEPAPNLDGHVDWETMRESAAKRLRAHVAELGYPSDVEVEWFVDPTDWQADGMERGTPFALSHRFLQSGPFRPRNVERRVPGLVFAGSGTVPGVGVPMVLISGRLAAERVQESIAR